MIKIDLDKMVMQSILRHANIGIHVIDRDKRTVVYNKYMADLEGLETIQVINKDLLEIFPSLNEET